MESNIFFLCGSLENDPNLRLCCSRRRCVCLWHLRVSAGDGQGTLDFEKSRPVSLSIKVDLAYFSMFFKLKR